MPTIRSLRAAGVVTLAALGLATGCQDLSSFSTSREQQYVGCVVPADFVLAGVSSTTELCMTLDANELQTAPGTVTSSDGLFQATAMRPIPQLWNDPLSTLNFGQGRTKNLLYMATPASEAGAAGDVTVVVSLMEGGNVEARLVRGAPPGNHVFAVFPLTLQRGGCASLSAKHCAPDAQ
jgi:hypothetical protein